MHANDLFTTITAQLIDDIETGAAGNWRMPWHHLADAGTPTSIDQRPYRGMNAVWLAMIGAAHGWTSGSFGTSGPGNAMAPRSDVANAPPKSCCGSRPTRKTPSRAMTATTLLPAVPG